MARIADPFGPDYYGARSGVTTRPWYDYQQPQVAAQQPSGIGKFVGAMGGIGSFVGGLGSLLSIPFSIAEAVKQRKAEKWERGFKERQLQQKKEMAERRFGFTGLDYLASQRERAAKRAKERRFITDTMSVISGNTGGNI